MTSANYEQLSQVFTPTSYGRGKKQLCMRKQPTAFAFVRATGLKLVISLLVIISTVPNVS